MKNKIIKAVVILIVLFLGWYLFLKQGDYIVTFNAKADASVLAEAIYNWGDDLVKSENVDVIVRKDSLFSEIKQTIKKKDSSYTLIWNIKQLNDSISKVKVFVSEENHSLKNRLLIPFSNASIKKYAINSMLDFNKGFQKYLKTFKIKSNEIDSIPTAFCACISANSTQKQKASKMLLLNLDLTSFLRENYLDMNGGPLLQVTSWNKEDENITFDFCFPILKKEIMPTPKNGIFYKEIKSKSAVKATYNGNYRYSDRAWNYLINNSKNKKIKVEQLPTEVFFNDPQQGGDELSWKAEIYLPIIK